MLTFMKKIIYILIASFSTFSYAQEISQMMKNCQTEYKQYCTSIAPGDGAILRCLQKQKLSEKCANSVTPLMKFRVESGEEFQFICKAELFNFCTEVKPGEGRQIKCLQAQKKSLSPACITEIEKFQKSKANKK